MPYLGHIKRAVLLSFSDSRLALAYAGGFVARASTVAVSLFVPLFINTYFIRNGFCHGSPTDTSPELKRECGEAYVLSSILTGVAQLAGLISAPIFGHLSSRTGRINYPILVATGLGIAGHVAFPQLPSPEIRNRDGRGGSPVVFLVVILMGISQTGAIVCSMGSLSQGILAAEAKPTSRRHEGLLVPDEYERAETDPLIGPDTRSNNPSRMPFKGTIAGLYSLGGGVAILLLTKAGGVMFDRLSNGAPFYLMAIFNGVLLVACLVLNASTVFSRV